MTAMTRDPGDPLWLKVLVFPISVIGVNQW